MLCCDWIKDHIIPLLALVVSLLTLILGVKAYKRFLLQQLKQKQLAIVLQLLSQINDDKNKYVSISSAVWPFEPKSVFDFACLDSFNVHEKLFFAMNAVVAEGQNNLLKWGFVNEYCRNPLLPLSIADKLRVFIFPDKPIHKPVPLQQILNFASGDKKILIGNGDFGEISTVVCYSGTHFEYADTFQKSAKARKKEIIGWLKRHGITDINLFKEDENVQVYVYQR